jgi:hypothetical protein
MNLLQFIGELVFIILKFGHSIIGKDDKYGLDLTIWSDIRLTVLPVSNTLSTFLPSNSGKLIIFLWSNCNSNSCCIGHLVFSSWISFRKSLSNKLRDLLIIKESCNSFQFIFVFVSLLSLIVSALILCIAE